MWISTLLIGATTSWGSVNPHCAVPDLVSGSVFFEITVMVFERFSVWNNRQKYTDFVHFPCVYGIFLTLKDLLIPMGGLLWKFLILFGFMLYCFCFRVLVGFMSSSVSTFLEMMRIRFWRNSPCVENKNRKAFLWMKFFYDVDTATPMENFMM